MTLASLQIDNEHYRITVNSKEKGREEERERERRGREREEGEREKRERGTERERERGREIEREGESSYISWCPLKINNRYSLLYVYYTCVAYTSYINPVCIYCICINYGSVNLSRICSS